MVQCYKAKRQYWVERQKIEEEKIKFRNFSHAIQARYQGVPSVFMHGLTLSVARITNVS